MVNSFAHLQTAAMAKAGLTRGIVVSRRSLAYQERDGYLILIDRSPVGSRGKNLADLFRHPRVVALWRKMDLR